MDNLETLKRILKREREARKQAETIIEEKSRELFYLNQQLKDLNTSLEKQVADRTVELKRKVEELKDSNRYKSEFLANMSHELRTPLNSILLLARILRDNKENNFTPKQIEYAKVIFNSGTDLLSLINDILDLAKIEAGRVDLILEDVSVLEIKSDLQQMFKGLSEEKNINFNIELESDFPAFFQTDRTKLLQVVRNLLSNAFKFTHNGGNIFLKFFKEENQIKIVVEDDGIGIEKEKLDLVFEAFQQADGSTSRKYGGTGLGLSICKELIALMNGTIHVESEVGKGSVFTIHIPFVSDLTDVGIKLPLEDKDMNSVLSVKEKIYQGQERKVNNQPLLIIEDDERFVKILKDFSVEKGLSVVVASQGDTGLYFAKKFQPISILLDIQLPVMSGWEVLKELKSDPETADIPVHIFSVVDKEKLGLSLGAESYKVKPININDLESTFEKIIDLKDQSKKECLILAKDSTIFPQYYQALQNHYSNVRFSSEYSNALFLLRENNFGTLVLLEDDLQEPAFSEFMDAIHLLCTENNQSLKIYLPNDALSAVKEKMEKGPLDIIIGNQALEKDYGISHLNVKQKSNGKEKGDPSEFLQGKEILLVEDEMRNVFALDSVLEPYGAKIQVANNGQEALDCLKENHKYDIVLMDIMMPVMDGYEAMAHIRNHPDWKKLKIIAVTAKAMKGDAEKCLEAGANAYVSKPIDVDELYKTMYELLDK